MRGKQQKHFFSLYFALLLGLFAGPYAELLLVYIRKIRGNCAVAGAYDPLSVWLVKNNNGRLLLGVGHQTRDR